MSRLAATRIFTDDVDGMLAFYAQLTGIEPDRLHPLFVEIATATGTLAIASARTVPLLGEGVAEAAANRSVGIDLLVDDVDALLPRLRDAGIPIVAEPADMPWGNRSLLIRDPDGTLITLFAPTTPAARERFGLA